MEISFKDILKIIKKNIILIIAVSVVASLLSFIISNYFIPKEYTSRVKLYVESTADASQSNYNALNSANYAKSVVPTYIEMLETTKFYSQVATALDNKYTPAEISRKITFKTIEDSEVFQAVVVDENPTDAKAIADAVALVAPEILSTFNDDANLKVVDDATLPKSPSSPNVTKNVAIAFSVSLVLILIFVFAKELLNTKIKYTPDMNEILGVPVLSAIPDFEEITSTRKIQQ